MPADDDVAMPTRDGNPERLRGSVSQGRGDWDSRVPEDGAVTGIDARDSTEGDTDIRTQRAMSS